MTFTHLLFAVVNLARHLEVDAEASLRRYQDAGATSHIARRILNTQTLRAPANAAPMTFFFRSR